MRRVRRAREPTAVGARAATSVCIRSEASAVLRVLEHRRLERLLQVRVLLVEARSATLHTPSRVVQRPWRASKRIVVAPRAQLTAPTVDQQRTLGYARARRRCSTIPHASAEGARSER